MALNLSRFLCLAGLGLGLSLGLAGGSMALAADEQWPHRAQDLHYGTILYDHYQGRSFDALTGFAVAARQGGIQGHGEHPELIRGSVMLAYGMTREAQALFEALLDDSGVDPATRNLAWFYLGKVYYLEGDIDRSQQALARVTVETLAEEAPDRHEEWLYLQGQLSLRTADAEAAQPVETFINQLPADSLYRHYLRYNLASKRLSEGDGDGARMALESLAAQFRTAPMEEGSELQALQERTLLSLGELHLQHGQYQDAQSQLASIRLDSPFSDQALYHYALAAAGTESWGLALQALDTLQQRPLFSPWLQQVPYARGYVIEQLQRPQRAMRAYREAAEHYDRLLGELEQASDRLTEGRIVDALQRAPMVARDDPLLPNPAQATVVLGDPSLANDAYGRLQLQPEDYALAWLLSQESFQLALRDLHELYRLQRLMARWQDQLLAFDAMLVTRQTQRDRMIEQTRAAMVAQDADQWLSRQRTFQRKIDQALAAGDAAFFMTDEQRASHDRIQRVLANLDALPDDEKTAQQRRKIERIKAFFDWQVANDYGVNRWAAQKQLRELNTAMAEFSQRRDALASEMNSAGENADLAARVADSQRRVAMLAVELDQALNQARAALIDAVRADFERQQQTVRRFLVASRHAQARLADALLNGGGSHD